MAEQPSIVAKEAKGTHQSLKEALKSREPWDREVDILRKSLRRQYIRLLLVHPYARESKDAENYLWMQTSHTFIATYRQRIAALDRTISAPRTQSNNPQQQQQQQQPQQPPQSGPVEYRKLLQRFRQFLAEEDKFWRQLVGRFRRAFALDEAQPVLASLDIPNLVDNHTDTADAQPAPTHLNSTSNGNTTHGANPPSGGPRSNSLFPGEDPVASVAPRTRAQKESQLAILSKMLVCLGDIARYRELYNESGGRPKAGHEDSVPPRKIVRGKRGGPPQEVLGRMRNYDKARQCYEHARLLVPSEGNASHQLAILASYREDSFESLAHYYRALCVRQPYDTASENLGTVLSKALGQWRARARKEKGASSKDGEREGAELTPLVKYEMFREKLVVLHALWRLGVEKMDAISPKHAQDVRDAFFSLVAERGLPPDTILKTAILSQGALWKHRMLREPTPATATSGPSTDGEDPTISAPAARAIEARMLAHVLTIHEALLHIGVIQLAETPPKDVAQDDLAQRITAEFRRTLPAMRIASKWLRANFRYVLQSHELEETSTRTGAGAGANTHRRKESSTAEPLGPCVSQFWNSYARFMTSLWRTFPRHRLPALSAPLEEDVDLRGFLPLQQIGADHEDKDLPSNLLRLSSTEHPNDEQLMRIADMLDDAKHFAEMENSVIVFSRNEYIVRNPLPATTVSLRNHISKAIGHDLYNVFNAKERDDDAMTERTSRTDDDPVGDAFRQVLDAELDDDEDEIVWDPRPPLSPVGTAIPILPSPPSHASPITPMKPTLSPIGTSARSPTLSKGQSPFVSPLTIPAAATTAQDLLNNVMGVSRTPGSTDLFRSHRQESSAPQPQLLFGSGPPNQPDHSIWSTTLDDQSLNLASTGASMGHSYHTTAAQQHLTTAAATAQEPSHAVWSPLYSSLPVPQPSTSFSLPSHGGMVNPSSHRRSSSTTTISQLFANQNRITDDPFAFPPITSVQQSISTTAEDPRFRDTGAYPRSIGDNHGLGLRYGQHDNNNNALQDYHRGTHHNHKSRVGHSLAGPPLSSVWGHS